MREPNHGRTGITRFAVIAALSIVFIGGTRFVSRWTAAKRQEQAIAKLPGPVLYAHQRWEYGGIEGPVVDSTPPGAPWLRRILGDSFFFVPNEVDLDLYEIQDDDLRCLEDLPSVRKVDLTNTPISDDAFKYLAPLKDLEELKFDNTEVTSLAMAQLKGFTKLKVLFLPQFDEDTFDVNDLQVLTRFTNLEELVIDHDPLGERGISYLAGLTKLRTLRLIDVEAPPGSFRYLSKLTGLDWLHARGIDINDEDIKSLSKCTKLQAASLEGRRLTNASCEVIATLHELRYLSLGEFYINDDNVKYFEGLKKLDTLLVEDITASAQGRLQKALPNLEIYPQRYRGCGNAGLIEPGLPDF
jgi:Leucine-rich repeat (LRR) protein